MYDIIIVLAIGNAFAVLSDAEKRKQYDLYGSDEARRHSHSHMYQEHDFGYDPRFEGKIFPQDVQN